MQITKAVLKDFLTTKTSDVLALTGAWGTGKTYAWHEALSAHKGSVKFKHYCYVSLFGIKSMAELRMALFTKSVAVATFGEKLDLAAINEHWGALTKDWVKAQYARWLPMFKSLPHGSSVSLGLEVLAPSAVRDTLVCLDDFERLTGIEAADILGLITELSEERGCKVALIFNADQLASKDVYRAYREKAVDFEVLYAPTVQEAFDLVFSEQFPRRAQLLRHVVDLGVTNVRILRKMRESIERILTVTAQLHESVTNTAIATTVLFCWCAYAQDASKPNLANIEAWNTALVSFKTEEVDPADQAWVQRLKAYGFIHVDDMDLAIARVVERGYLEGSGFAELAQQMDQSARGHEKSERFSAVWRRFHDSFVGDQDEFITDLHSAALEAIATVGSGDLDGTVRLLRNLERDDLADELIESYIDAHVADPSAFDLKEHPFGGSINDTRLRQRFDEVYSGLNTLPTLLEAVSFMVRHSGFNDEHVKAMKQASIDDYEAMFRANHTDPKLPSLIKWCLRWSGGEHAVITENARAALMRIKETSLLNAIRVSRYGL